MGSNAREKRGLRGRVQELESVLRSVQEEFRRFGDRFPDGFDHRLFGWVDDALASAKPLPRDNTSEIEP